jgi:hypothetical protein
VDFRPAYQRDRDINIVLTGLLGDGPSGEQASAWFEREMEEAWNRLTPKMQTALLLSVNRKLFGNDVSEFGPGDDPSSTENNPPREHPKDARERGEMIREAHRQHKKGPEWLT